MIDELIQNITQAERDAEEIIHNAHIAAKQLVIEAGVQAEEMLKAAKIEYKALEAITLAELDRQASDITTKSMAVVKEEAEEVIALAEKSVGAAVELIIGRIKSKYEAN